MEVALGSMGHRVQPAARLVDSCSGKLPVTPRDGSGLGWNAHANVRQHSVAMASSVSSGVFGALNGEGTLRPHAAQSELGKQHLLSVLAVLLPI